MNEGESSGVTNTPEIGGVSPQFSSAPSINTQQEQKIETVTASSSDYANAFSVTSAPSNDKNVTVGAASAIKAGQGSGDAVLAGDARYATEEKPQGAISSAPAFFTEEMAKRDTKKPKTKLAKQQTVVTLDNTKKKSPLRLLVITAIILIVVAGGIFAITKIKNSSNANKIAIKDFNYDNYSRLERLTTFLSKNADISYGNEKPLISEMSLVIFNSGIEDYEKFINDFENLEIPEDATTLKNYKVTLSNALSDQLQQIKTMRDELTLIKKSTEGDSESLKALKSLEESDEKLSLLDAQYAKYHELESRQLEIGCDNADTYLSDDNCSMLNGQIKDLTKNLDWFQTKSLYIRAKLKNPDYPAYDPLAATISLIRKAQGL